MKEILIASSTIDQVTYGPVVEKLSRAGCRPIVYCSDQVASSEKGLSIFHNGETTQVAYSGEEFFLEQISAAWFRHPELLGYPDNDQAAKMCIESEAQRLQDYLWSEVDEDKWVNSPVNISSAQNKLGQLSSASELGFNTPRTIVTNSWQDVLGMECQVVMKMPIGTYYEDNTLKAMYAKVLNRHDVEMLSNVSMPFPGIFQEYVSKKREWRITVVADEVFSASIYTQDSAKDDWRKHQTKGVVDFRSETPDEGTVSRCVELVKKLGLRFGCLDLIEDHDGDVSFIEVNPNGQYQWLEDLLDLPISGALSGLLLKIAEQD